MKSKLFFASIITLVLLSFPLRSIAETNPEEDKTVEEIVKRLTQSSKTQTKKYTIELVYGASALSMPDTKISTDFGAPFIGEAKYGFTQTDTDLEIPGIFRYAQQHAFFGTYSIYIRPPFIEETDIWTEAWKFGFGLRNAFGYKRNGNKFLSLYHSGNINWTLIFADAFIGNPGEPELMVDIGEQFRFGNSFDAGANLNVGKDFNLNLAYEQTHVYKRHIVLQWATSKSINFAAQTAVDYFAPELMKMYGRDWPWMNFVLKGGISYLIYSLRTPNMNWPYSSTPPLKYEAVKIGFTYHFI